MMRKDADIHIRIPTSWLKAIRELAAKDKRKVAMIIDIALENYLKARKVLR